MDNSGHQDRDQGRGQDRDQGRGHQGSRGRPQGGANQGQRHSGNNYRGGRHHGSKSQMGANVAHELVNASGRKLKGAAFFDLFFKAFLAGGIIVIAMVFAGYISRGYTGASLFLLLSFALSSGMFLIVASSNVLLTEANVMINANFQDSIGKSFVRLFLFWMIAFFGNWIGALFFAWVFHFIGLHDTVLPALQAIGAVHEKNPSMLQLVMSGVIANWVIGFAAMFSVYNRAAMGKILVLFVTVAMIVGTGLMYFPFELAYFTVIKLGGEGPSWLSVLADNLVPVAIGNLIGGGLLVAVPLAYQTRRKQHSHRN